MIVADDVVAEKGGDPREGVAEDGAANVPDVHRLGDVGRTEIDHDALRRIGGRDAEALVPEEFRGLARRSGSGAERKVDEPCAGDRQVVRIVPKVV